MDPSKVVQSGIRGALFCVLRETMDGKFDYIKYRNRRHELTLDLQLLRMTYRNCGMERAESFNLTAIGNSSAIIPRDCEAGSNWYAFI